VPLPEGKGQPLAEVMDPRADPLLAQAPDGLQFGPARGHIHAHEGGEEEALGGLATVEHEIALERAGPDRGPVTPGAEGDLALEGSRSSRAAWLTAEPAADGPEPPVDGGGAEALQGLAQRGGQGEGAVALEGGHEQGEEWGEQLAAEAVADLPQADQDGHDLGAIAAGPPAAASTPRRRVLAEPADGRLAMASRGPTILVQDPPLLLFGRRPIAGAQRLRVLVPSVVGHSAPPVLGNRIYEASAPASVTIFMRQIARETSLLQSGKIAAPRFVSTRKAGVAQWQSS